MPMYPLMYPQEVHALYRDAVSTLTVRLCQSPQPTTLNVMIIGITCPHCGQHGIKVDRRIVRKYVIAVNARAHHLVEQYFAALSMPEKRQYHDGILDISRQYFPLFGTLLEQEKINRQKTGNAARSEHRRIKNQAIRLLLETHEVSAAALFEFTACYRKNRYETEQDATAALAAGVHNHDQAYVTYACGYCAGYHVGHSVGKTVPYLYRLSRAKMIWGTNRQLANQFVLARELQAQTPHEFAV